MNAVAFVDEAGQSAAHRPVLCLENVSTTLPTPSGALRAVQDVSLEIYPNETLGLVGESGSGKSMLGRTILDILPSRASVAGAVRLDGRDLRAEGSRGQQYRGSQVAMIFQNPMTSLNPVRTIGKQITDPIEHHLRMTRRDAKQRAIELLVQVGVAAPRERLDQYPHELSGGMRQRVAIAIALSCKPKVLIADEPTTALDVTVQKQVLDLMQRLQNELDMSILLITHDLGVVAGRAGRVAVMYGGQIVEVAATLDLFTNMRHPYTRALLQSVPRLNDPPHVRRATLPGRPPNLTLAVPGCPFQPRCPNRQDRCAVEAPELTHATAAGHQFACFYPVMDPVGQAHPVQPPGTHPEP